MTWDDCHALYDLPQTLRLQPELSRVKDFAGWVSETLANTASSPETSSEAHHTMLHAQINKLPLKTRRAMLKGCRLDHAGMLILLSSDQQLTDSEDDMALILMQYIKDRKGVTRLSAKEIKSLQKQLRYQYMSNRFVGLCVPSIPSLAIDSDLLYHLMYLRGLKGGDSIPRKYQQSKVPAAWYAPARTTAATCSMPASITLTLKLSEKTLSQHLDAAVLLKSGKNKETEPTSVQDSAVVSRGVSWRIKLSSCSVSQLLYLGVKATEVPFSLDSTACKQAGVYASITYCCESASPVITYATKAFWAGKETMGITNFVQKYGKRAGDPLDLAWWKDYIQDGHLCFSATIHFPD